MLSRCYLVNQDKRVENRTSAPERTGNLHPRIAMLITQLTGVRYAGQQVVLIWDGLSAHWSHRMRAFLDSQHVRPRPSIAAASPEAGRQPRCWPNQSRTLA